MEKKTYYKVYWLGKIHSFTDSPICPTMVLVSWGWDNKVAQAEWFKKNYYMTEIYLCIDTYYMTVLVATHPRLQSHAIGKAMLPWRLQV